MKRVFTLMTLLVTFSISAQRYEIGAMEAMGFAYKMKGKLEITDTMMLIELDTKDGFSSIDYDIVNERNGITYVSDGTETFNTSILKREGKKKGYKYNYTMSFIHPAGQMILYYLNEL